MRRFVRDHSLSIVTLGAFLVIWLGGQAWAGHRAYNDDQRDHGEPTVGFVEYLSQADVGGPRSRTGSPSSCRWACTSCSRRGWCRRARPNPSPPAATRSSRRTPAAIAHDPDAPWPVRRGGWVLRVYENSVSIAMLGLFVLAFTGDLVTGA
jgi:Domain of unknown function (DUF6766)